MISKNQPLLVRLMKIWQQRLWFTFGIWLECYALIALSGIREKMGPGFFVLGRILPLLLGSPVC